MNLNVKNSKSCTGSDGVAWSCDVYDGKRKIASATNAGRGGDTVVWWTDPAKDRARCEEYARAAPKPPGYEELEMTFGTLVAHLADEHDTRRRLRRLCKDKTVYRTAETPADRWEVVRAPFTPEVRARLAAKGAIEFANEKVA